MPEINLDELRYVAQYGYVQMDAGIDVCVWLLNRLPAILAELEQGRRVEAVARVMAKRITDFEACLSDRGELRKPYPCHGQPMGAMFHARDEFRSALAAEQPREVPDARD